MQTAAKSDGSQECPVNPPVNVSATTKAFIKDFAQLLTEEILAIDSKLLAKVKAAHDVAGKIT